MRFRKQPVVIDAVQFSTDGLSRQAVRDFLGDAGHYDVDTDSFVIPTLEGEMRARREDWIIKGVKGEFYPCKPDIFEATYELDHLDEKAADIEGFVVALKGEIRRAEAKWPTGSTLLRLAALQGEVGELAEGYIKGGPSRLSSAYVEAVQVAAMAYRVTDALDAESLDLHGDLVGIPGVTDGL